MSNENLYLFYSNLQLKLDLQDDLLASNNKKKDIPYQSQQTKACLMV